MSNLGLASVTGVANLGTGPMNAQKGGLSTSWIMRTRTKY